MGRIYKTLTQWQEKKVRAQLKAGWTQKDIAKYLGIAKQRVATFARKKDIGKRRAVRIEVKVRATADGWQLNFLANFKNIKTGEEKKGVECHSHFHKTKNYAVAYQEAIKNGQAGCAGDLNYEEDNEVWIPTYIYKIGWTRWQPR